MFLSFRSHSIEESLGSGEPSSSIDSSSLKLKFPRPDLLDLTLELQVVCRWAHRHHMWHHRDALNLYASVHSAFGNIRANTLPAYAAGGVQVGHLAAFRMKQHVVKAMLVAQRAQ